MTFHWIPRNKREPSVLAISTLSQPKIWNHKSNPEIPKLTLCAKQLISAQWFHDITKVLLGDQQRINKGSTGLSGLFGTVSSSLTSCFEVLFGADAGHSFGIRQESGKQKLGNQANFRAKLFFAGWETDFWIELVNQGGEGWVWGLTINDFFPWILNLIKNNPK